MKELPIEEKAKAYDEALKKARILVGYPTTQPFISDLQDLFPELSESEDERIKKWLIELVEEVRKANPTNAEHNGNCSDAIAWLEKQGETFTKRDIDDAYLKGVTDTKNEIEKQYEANYQIRKDIATFIFNYRGDIKDRTKWIDYLGIKVSFIENQGEQKPAWSEEDEENLTNCIEAINLNYKWDNMVDWLKSLKDRCLPQPKQEWCEEDENMLNNTITLIKHYCKLSGVEKDASISWLKSLRPQSQWKPSERQKEALLWCVVHLGGADKQALGELLEELNKL